MKNIDIEKAKLKKYKMVKWISLAILILSFIVALSYSKVNWCVTACAITFIISLLIYIIFRKKVKVLNADIKDILKMTKSIEDSRN